MGIPIWHVAPWCVTRGSTETPQSTAVGGRAVGAQPCWSLCPLTPLEPPPAGDMNLCPSWGRAQGVLAQLRADAGAASPQATGSHSAISHPQRTVLQRNPREIHSPPWDAQGGFALPVAVCVWVAGVTPGSAAALREERAGSGAEETDVPWPCGASSSNGGAQAENVGHSLPREPRSGKPTRINTALLSHKLWAQSCLT